MGTSLKNMNSRYLRIWKSQKNRKSRVLKRELFISPFFANLYFYVFCFCGLWSLPGSSSVRPSRKKKHMFVNSLTKELLPRRSKRCALCIYIPLGGSLAESCSEKPFYCCIMFFVFVYVLCLFGLFYCFVVCFVSFVFVFVYVFVFVLFLFLVFVFCSLFLVACCLFWFLVFIFFLFLVVSFVCFLLFLVLFRRFRRFPFRKPSVWFF